MRNRLILGHRPGHGTKFEMLESSSTRRLDSLMRSWRAQFIVRNLYSSDLPDIDQDLLDAMSLDALIRDNSVRVIVALGDEASRHLAPHSRYDPWLSWHRAPAVGWVIDVLKFPHPSGRNRWWNDPEHVELAREALFDAALKGRLDEI